MQTNSPGYTLVRFGVAIKVTSGSQGSADIAMQVSLQQFGRLLAPFTAHLVATSTTPVFIPIGPWMPALGVTKFEFACVIGDRTVTFQLDLVYRTANASPEDPESWSSGILAAVLNSNGETCSTKRSVTA